MVTPAAEAALLKADQFTPDWERSLDETAIKWARLLVPPNPHDIDEVDESWLPFMAVYYNAIAFTDLLGMEFQRRSIKEGVFLNTWAGWPASVDRFARDAEFAYTFTYNFGGTPNRRTSLDLYITPSSFSQQSASCLPGLRGPGGGPAAAGADQRQRRAHRPAVPRRRAHQRRLDPAGL